MKIAEFEKLLHEAEVHIGWGRMLVKDGDLDMARIRLDIARGFLEWAVREVTNLELPDPEEQVQEGEQSQEESDEALIDKIIDVRVVSVRSYGAICRIEGGTRTMLLHISKIAPAFIKDVSEWVREGDLLKAKVIRNPKGELGLSVKDVPKELWPEHWKKLIEV